jgi:type VI protein secretion system component Hcp
MGDVKYFLKLDGIPGESQDPRHQGEIELTNFTWQHDGPDPSGGIGLGGRPRPACSCVTPTDSTTAALSLALGAETSIKEAVITQETYRGAPLKQSLRLRLKGVQVTYLTLIRGSFDGKSSVSFGLVCQEVLYQ